MSLAKCGEMTNEGWIQLTARIFSGPSLAPTAREMQAPAELPPMVILDVSYTSGWAITYKQTCRGGEMVRLSTMLPVMTECLSHLSNVHLPHLTRQDQGRGILYQYGDESEPLLFPLSRIVLLSPWTPAGNGF